jgi:SAM-dependent methyltransferase
MALNLSEGYYSRKQLQSESLTIRWSHNSRFKKGLELSTKMKGERILDFGCGDGTFLAMLLGSEFRPRAAVGAELLPEIVEENRERFRDVPGLDFIRQEDLESSGEVELFDGIICMEVLEHAIDRIHYLDLFRRLLRPGGRLIVSVPVETGLPLVVKTVMRNIAGWRGIGHYPGPHPYTATEFIRSIFAGSSQHITRPETTNGSRSGKRWQSHCHKGFNWLVAQREISERFVIDRVTSSPLSFLPPQLGSQAWFEAHLGQS